MIEILSLAGKLSVDWTAFCLHANVRFLGAMVTTLNTLRATIDVYQTARKGFKYGEKIMHECAENRALRYHSIESECAGSFFIPDCDGSDREKDSSLDSTNAKSRAG